MSQRSETFGRLLKGAINSIAAYEGKAAPAIEEELGAQIGVAGSSIQRYKAGYLPTEPRAVQVLAEAAVRRGFLSRAWLQRFLQAARYTNPDALIAQLSDGTGQVNQASFERGLPSGTLTFLFTDIEGSTTRWERQPQAMERALARHDELLRQAVDAYGGQVVKTVGDAFQAVFTTTPAALEAALGAQRALRDEAWGPIEPLRVRMALHVGIVQQRDGGYFGHTLNRVARLCAAGHGGQVLLSNAAQELVHDLLPPGTHLRDLGEHQLKDLARREHIFQVVTPDLPADFPALRSLDRYRHNLPANPTPFIGREAEVQAVCDLLRREGVRLVTLTGPGGIGKTRLALQAAAELLDDFRDGVYFVALAPIRDPALVPAAVAQVLGVKELGDRPLLEVLKHWLHDRQALLVLDNFEQVTPAASQLNELLAAAPQLHIIVTSRALLHVYGEHEYGVPALRLPDLRQLPPIERLTQYEAVRLFIERAQALRRDFAVTNENAPAIAEICARLEGLPLAIEMAASRSKLFPPKALLARLNKRLSLLTGGANDLPARQQTLRNTIAWSYDLLDATEQTIFTRLAIFEGGCRLTTAEAVLADDKLDSMDELTAYISSDTVLDGLTSLVDKSLLKQVEDSGSEPRFVMLEMIREYALEQLAASGEEAALRVRHAAYYLSFAERAEAKHHGPDSKLYLEQLEEEHPNLRAALHASFADGAYERAAQLCAALGWFWWIKGQFDEGGMWIEQVLPYKERLTPSLRAHLLRECVWVMKGAAHQLQALEESLALSRELDDIPGMRRTLATLSGLCYHHGDVAGARRYAEEGLPLARTAGDQAALAIILFFMGHIALGDGDYEAATRFFQEEVALHRAIGDQTWIASSMYALGELAYLQGDYRQAETYYAESLAINRAQGDRRATAAQLQNIARAVLRHGDTERASALLQESLQLFKELNWLRGIGYTFAVFAELANSQGQYERAARLLGAEEAIRLNNGHEIWPTTRVDYERTVLVAKEGLGEPLFVATWAEGQALPLEAAIALAESFSRPAESA